MHNSRNKWIRMGALSYTKEMKSSPFLPPLSSLSLFPSSRASIRSPWHFSRTLISLSFPLFHSAISTPFYDHWYCSEICLVSSIHTDYRIVYMSLYKRSAETLRSLFYVIDICCCCCCWWCLAVSVKYFMYMAHLNLMSSSFLIQPNRTNSLFTHINNMHRKYWFSTFILSTIYPHKTSTKSLFEWYSFLNSYLSCLLW